MALVTNAEYKLWAGEGTSDNDSLITQLINFATKVIGVKCDNDFELNASRSEDLDGNDKFDFFNLHYPVNGSITLLQIDGATITSANYKLYANEPRIHSDTRFALGEQNIHIEYSSGYTNDTDTPEDLKTLIFFVARKMQNLAQNLGVNNISDQNQTKTYFDSINLFDGLEFLLEKWMHPLAGSRNTSKVLPSTIISKSVFSADYVEVNI